MPEAHDAAWFAERLPPDDDLDELLSDDPTAALIGVARDRAPVETGVVQPTDLDEDPEAQRLFELAAPPSGSCGPASCRPCRPMR